LFLAALAFLNYTLKRSVRLRQKLSSTVGEVVSPVFAVQFPFASDPFIYLLAAGLVVVLAAILQPRFPGTLDITWTTGKFIACLSIAAVLVGIGAIGEKGWLKGPDTHPSDPGPTLFNSAPDTDPCSAGVPNIPQCYLSFGHAWNDIGKYDQAISLFQRSDKALDNTDTPRDWWQTRAYLYREWGYALLGKRSCPEAVAKFEAAKKIFESNNQNDGGAIQEGIVKAQQCKP
jgi:hypothetical protein